MKIGEERRAAAENGGRKEGKKEKYCGGGDGGKRKEEEEKECAFSVRGGGGGGGGSGENKKWEELLSLSLFLFPLSRLSSLRFLSFLPSFLLVAAAATTAAAAKSVSKQLNSLSPLFFPLSFGGERRGRLENETQQKRFFTHQPRDLGRKVYNNNYNWIPKLC